MPVQPGTHRSISRRPEVDREQSESSSFLDILTGPVARVLFALPFFVFGINHFATTDQLTGIVPEFIPGSVFWVYLTGVGFLATSVAIMANRFVAAAGMVLAVMLLGFVFTVHLPALLGGAEGGMAMSNLLKDTALAGGALLAAHFATHRERDAD